MAQVLIVDDDLQIRKVFSKLIEAEGHKVWVAEDGNQGLKELAKRPIDLIISDILMPDKDGLEMIDEVKKTYPNIKIIAISGGGQISSKEYLNLANHMGVVKSIPKPIMRNELIKTIKEVLA